MADLESALASILQVPGLQELLNQSITQQRQLAPLRTATTQQAANMLPDAAYGAGGRPDIASIAPANYTTPAPSGGSDLARTLSTLGAGAGIGGILARLLGGSGNSSGGNIGKLVRDLINKARNRNSKGNRFTGPLEQTNPDYFTGPTQTNDWDWLANLLGSQSAPPPPIPDTDTEFMGPIDDPSWYNGPDATYEPGGYNFSGPMPNTGP